MTHTILLLTANPKDTQPLDLQKEVVEITQLLQHAKISEQFTVHSAFAMTPAQLRIQLSQHRPDIVHFSGHGAGEDGIVLVDDKNQMQLVTTAALVNLFASFPKIQCVILNACYSALQASSLVEYVPFVIGMNQSILDRAALAFSSGFYQGLSAEKSISEAFAWGCNEIALRNLGEQTKPVLKQRREFAQRFENLPFERNPHFTGRDTVLRELLETLHFHGAAALSGMGGMGKTQTAVEFAYRYRHEYQAVLWCFADSAENLSLNLANLAMTLPVPLQQQQAENLKAVSEWLSTHEHWLLVVDNADDLKLLKPWLPRWKRGTVVVTTRADVTEPYVKRVALREMKSVEAVNLLWARATDVEFDALRSDHATLTERFHARQLAETLGYLPLALDQAGAYIRETQCNFARYLELFKQFPLRLLAKRGELYHDADHPDPVATTWLLSFDKVRAHPLATQILHQCAFLHGDGIVQTVFADLDPLEYDAAIREILRYSLLKREEQRGLLTMHRLIQIVLRAQLPEAEQQAVAGQVVTLLVAACSRDETDFTTWLQQRAEWLPNAREGARWIQQWQLQLEDAGTLLNNMGYYLEKIGNYDQALPLYQEALEIKEQVLGKQHPSYATSLNNLAYLYYSQGQYEQALPLYQEALKIDEQVYGRNHPDVATDLNNLAGLYRAQGKYEQALPLYQEALEIREHVLGKQHPDYTKSLNGLAVLYYSQGQYEQALPLYQEALKIREHVLGKQHPLYATSLNNLAMLYYSQGQYEQALPLFQEALKIREQVLGKQHSDYASSLNNLAGLYYSQGQYDQALPLSQEALKIFTKVLGEQHPFTQAVKRNYSGCLSDSKKE
jgi:tetratricopeptide (TPR) repeat protein